MPFDAATNSWSCMGQWDGPDYVYEEATDWVSRQPQDADGVRFSPALGIVTSKAIYISGEAQNREVHAALFTSGDVVKPAVSGPKTNLYILGAIITTGTNPVSSWFSYRCYAYDPNLRANPPPGFPGGDLAAFGNWHVVMPEDKVGSKGY